MLSLLEGDLGEGSRLFPEREGNEYGELKAVTPPIDPKPMLACIKLCNPKPDVKEESEGSEGGFIILLKRFR